MSAIERIRAKIRARYYYISSHAEEEMAEDEFARVDAENAILSGFVEKKLTYDPRGTRYRVEGQRRSPDVRDLSFQRSRVIGYHHGI